MDLFAAHLFTPALSLLFRTLSLDCAGPSALVSRGLDLHMDAGSHGGSASGGAVTRAGEAESTLQKSAGSAQRC